MSPPFARLLANLAVSILIALLVWTYYRRRRFPADSKYLTFGPRFWSGFVDGAVLWPVTFITTGLLFLDVPRSLAALLLIAESAAWLVYTVVMHARYGQTVGKMITKVRVVDCQNEGRISWHQAWLREGIPILLSLGLLVYEVSGVLSGRITPSAAVAGNPSAGDGSFFLLMTLPGLWFAAEVLTMLTNKKRRALHDFIAGTVVVRTNIAPEITRAERLPKPGPSVPSSVFAT